MQPKKSISAIVRHLPIIAKAMLMLVAAALIPLMFPGNGQGEHYDYAVGGIWRNNDLVAPYDFPVLKTQTELDQEIHAAKSKSLLYYTRDSSARGQAYKRLEQTVRRHPGLDVRRLRKTMDSIYRIGYVETPADMPDFESHTLVLLSGNVGSERMPSEFVMTLDIADPLLRDTLMVPDIVYDANRTQLELNSRLSLISVATDMMQQGDLIVAKGEYITKEKAQVIHSLEVENDNRFHKHYSPSGRFLGQFALCIIAFLALYMFLKNTRHPILEDSRKITFVLTLILLMSGATAVVVRTNPALVLAVPLCIVPVMIRIFFDMRVALYVHVTTIVILANMVPNPFEYIFYQLIAGMMSIVTVRNFENRSKFFVVSVVIFFAYSLIYTFGVLSQESTLAGITAERYLVFMVSSILTLLAYPLIYVFEKLFGLTTNLTLMELSSTNTPALRELSRRAPGTFQHAMQVANISEDVINEIGGNALLAKVGGLYHDIGKIEAPLFFTENQNSEFNPHDELDYVESAHVIIQHVRDGLKLAHKYRLPASVCDFIRTHHGTTVTGYFYAKQKNDHPDEPINIGDFRYPGPTPFTREAAVVMLVDSVEAACKSLSNHDKENIDRLVDAVIDDKINNNQLQNCNITFGDLKKIRKLLKSRMLSIYHARISYPVIKN